MPKLPSTQDLATPIPQPARGIVQPSFVGAEGKAIAQLGGDIAEAGEEFIKAQQRINNRNDAVDRADKLLKFGDANEQELEGLSAGGDPDLSTLKLLQSYGQGVMKRRDEFLGAHRDNGASPDSLARLRVKLLALESDVIGKAAGLSQAIGLAKQDSMFDKSVNPLLTFLISISTSGAISSIFNCF